MNTETLPKNIDVNNGISMAAAGHGAVSNISFSVLNVRRAMLNVTMSDGRPVPKNGTLVDGEGNYVTTVVDDGLVFLNDVDSIKSLILVNEDGQRQCEIHYHRRKKGIRTSSMNKRKGYVSETVNRRAYFRALLRRARPRGVPAYAFPPGVELRQGA